MTVQNSCQGRKEEPLSSPPSSSSSTTDLEGSYTMVPRVSDDDDLSLISDCAGEEEEEEEDVLSESTSSLDLGYDGDYEEYHIQRSNIVATVEAVSSNPDNYGILNTPELSMISLGGSNDTLKMPQMGSSSLINNDDRERVVYSSLPYDEKNEKLMRLWPDENCDALNVDSTTIKGTVNVLGFGSDRKSVVNAMANFPKACVASYYFCMILSGNDSSSGDNINSEDDISSIYAEAISMSGTNEKNKLLHDQDLVNLIIKGPTIALINYSGERPADELGQGFKQDALYSILERHNIPAITVTDQPIYFPLSNADDFLFSPNAPISISLSTTDTEVESTFKNLQSNLLFSPLTPRQLSHVSVDHIRGLLSVKGGYPRPASKLIVQSNFNLSQSIWAMVKDMDKFGLMTLFFSIGWLVLSVYTHFSGSPILTSNTAVSSGPATASSTISLSSPTGTAGNNNKVSSIRAIEKALTTHDPADKSVVLLKVEESDDGGGPQVMVYKDMASSSSREFDLINRPSQKLSNIAIHETLKAAIPWDGVMKTWNDIMDIGRIIYNIHAELFQSIYGQLGKYWSLLMSDKSSEKLKDGLSKQYKNILTFYESRGEHINNLKKRKDQISKIMTNQTDMAKEQISILTEKYKNNNLFVKQGHQWNQVAEKTLKDTQDKINKYYNDHVKNHDEILWQVKERSKKLANTVKSYAQENGKTLSKIYYDFDKTKVREYFFYNGCFKNYPGHEEILSRARSRSKILTNKAITQGSRAFNKVCDQSKNEGTTCWYCSNVLLEKICDYGKEKKEQETDRKTNNILGGIRFRGVTLSH